MAPPVPTANYYHILEIPPNAAPEDITKSYRRLALLRHPDRNPGAKDATAVFQLLQNAYETLSDPAKRRVYDIGFFHHHHHHHRHPRAKNRYSRPFNPATAAYFHSEAVARRAAAAEAARYDKYAAVKHRGLSALRAEYREVKEQVKVLDSMIRKLEEELRGLAECDRQDEEAEKEARNPKTWFWNFAGTAARREVVEEEAGRRATERRHREEGRRVRLGVLESKRREAGVLRDQLGEIEERYYKAKEESIDEVERAEQARMEREKAEGEEMERQWLEAEMERVRKMNEENARKAKDHMEEAWQERVDETGGLFREFNEPVEPEATKHEFWQEGDRLGAEERRSRETGGEEGMQRGYEEKDSVWDTFLTIRIPLCSMLKGKLRKL